MKTSMIYKGLTAFAVLAMTGIAQAAHLPSPCASGEVGAGTNCMYLVAESVANVYDTATGDRSASTGLDLQIAVWIDFGQTAVQGGAFDISFDTTNVTAMNWVWGADFTAGEQTLSGSQSATGYDGIQFDDFAGNGFGGTTGTQPGFSQVGTLNVTLSMDDIVNFGLAQPYTDATFPNCFAPGAASGAPAECVVTDFYRLTVGAQAQVVPLPAAAWFMLTGLGSLLGFSRKKAA